MEIGKRGAQIEVYDGGFEAWTRGESDYDPHVIREATFQAPEGTSPAELHAAADEYMDAHPPEVEAARAIQDEEADEDEPACRVLRLYIE